MPSKRNNKWTEYLSARRHIYNLFRSSVRLKKLIEATIRFTPERGIVLEVGFGSGLTSILLSDLGYQVTGIDVDRSLINYAKTRTERFRMMENIHFLRADACNLPFADKTFRTSFSQGLLEHFSDDRIIRTLTEQKRVSRTIIFDVPSNRSKLGPDSFGNERFLSVQHYRKLITSAGLKIIFMYGRGFSKFAYMLPLWILRIFDYHFGYNIGFICREKANNRSLSVIEKVKKI